MMNFFPVQHKDELLYSLLSRYQRMAGITSKQALRKDLYGGGVYTKSIFCPQYIQKIVDNLPVNSRLDADTLIRNNTLYPALSAFLPEQRMETIYECARYGSNSNVERYVGIMGSKIKMPQYLRYCPQCLREDIKVRGEGYWRRIHQLPGVLICDKHGIILQDSTVLTNNSQTEYLCADADVCFLYADQSPISERLLTLNKTYISNVRYLLGQEVKRKSSEFIRNFYIDLLIRKGFASANGHIHMAEMQFGFISFFTHDYLAMMQCDIEEGSRSNWLTKFVRSTTKAKSFLLHIMLLQYLDVDVRELFEAHTVRGKTADKRQFQPKNDRKKMRRKWMKLIKNNPDASRSRLKELGKGLHTWIFGYDRDWYEAVSPAKRVRGSGKNTVDWASRDDECLLLVMRANAKILALPRKPVRVTKEALRKAIGCNKWLNDKRLIKTHTYINEMYESIDSFRRRKIRWAITDMEDNELVVTSYKIQLYSGFGGNNAGVREIIEEELDSNPNK